jgi:hypothetical protein
MIFSPFYGTAMHTLLYNSTRKGATFVSRTVAYHIIGSYATAFFQQNLENEPSSLLVPAKQTFPQAVLRQEV